MAIIRNTASALRRGKVGNETYYVALNKQVVRVAQNDSNYGETASRTIGQQGNRVRWSNLVQFYKLSKGWMAKAFENKKAGQSDYNRFMQLNLATARIYFTKEAVAASACVVDEFTISQGSLRSINTIPLGAAYTTDIALGNLTIGAETTVAEFTTAVLDNNNWARENMQISFVSYQQTTDSLGFPIAICTPYELTLSKTNTQPVRAYLPEFCSQSASNGMLGTNNNISVGGFAYILSQSVGGKTLVSTQKLITKNTGFITQYSSDRMRELAIYSYGLDEASFLDSGSLETRATSQPIFIQSMKVAGTTNPFLPGDEAPKAAVFSNKAITLNLSAALATAATLNGVSVLFNNGNVHSFEEFTLSTDRKSISFTMLSIGSVELVSVDVEFSIGTFAIEFVPSSYIYE